jgi:hypothetical protein
VHHLAAALLQSAGSGHFLELSVEELAADFRKSGNPLAVPANVAELCHRAGKVPGVALSRVLAELASQPQLQEMLEQLTSRAGSRPEEPESFAPEFAAWDPVIAALVAASGGDADAAEELDLTLPSDEDRSRWPLGDVLRQIFHGNHDPDLADLDEADAAVARRALNALTGQIAVPTALWPAISLGPLLSVVVLSAAGNARAATRAREELDDLAAANPGNVPVAQVLEQILGGDHSPDLPAGLEDPTDRAIVTTVLQHIG